MHSEKMRDLDLCISEYTKLNEAMKADDAITWNIENTLNAGKDHQNTVAKFGRYPTRNKALGRTSTDAEIEYLENANSYG